jgi:hypothetical protein
MTRINADNADKAETVDGLVVMHSGDIGPSSNVSATKDQLFPSCYLLYPILSA